MTQICDNSRIRKNASRLGSSRSCLHELPIATQRLVVISATRASSHAIQATITGIASFLVGVARGSGRATGAGPTHLNRLHLIRSLDFVKGPRLRFSVPSLPFHAGESWLCHVCPCTSTFVVSKTSVATAANGTCWAGLPPFYVPSAVRVGSTAYLPSLETQIDA